MSRANHNYWLIGMITSVLKEDFILECRRDDFDISDWFPFVGKRKLPTRMEVLKLWYFLRVEEGKQNGWVKAGTLNTIVAKVVEKYWHHAGSCWKTKAPLSSEVDKLLTEYQKLFKSKGRTDAVKYSKELKSREEFLNSCNKLFDVAHPQLEEILNQNRILGNLGVRDQDLRFLQDQRGPGHGFMAKEDI